MTVSIRYLAAMLVNILLPWAAYHLALPYVGLSGALIASAVPVLAWLTVDWTLRRHFDALSALLLVGIGLSLAVQAVVPQWFTAIRGPAVSGCIGLLFLVSLMSRRPLVYYLARSTLARERDGGELRFDVLWRDRPELASAIRLLTAVWGAGLLGEVLLRFGLSGSAGSKYLDYATYGCLSLWTFIYRVRYKRRHARVQGS